MYAWLAAGQPTNDSAVPETTVVPQSGAEHDLMVESSTNEAQPAALAPLPAVAATAAAEARATAAEVVPMDTERSPGFVLSAGEADSTNTSTSISTSLSIYQQHNDRDDAKAPPTVLRDARDLRRSIHTNTDGGKGLIIHSFLIRRRRSGEVKSKKKAHAYSG